MSHLSGWMDKSFISVAKYFFSKNQDEERKFSNKKMNCTM
jgi:hypothetical protein